MTTLNLQTTIGQLVRERPGRSRLFEQLGIDYCCGGKIPLAQACTQKGLDPQQVLDQLHQSDLQGSASFEGQTDFSSMSLTELADHVQNTHHAYLKQELPRLGYMVRKVAAVHGQHHPWMLQVDEIYAGFATEMESHMIKEERVLFPLIRQLDGQSGQTSPQPRMSIAGPISVMEHEHDDAGSALAKIKALSDGYAPPEGACNTFRAMLDALAHLEKDLHQHVHKENNILFPNALAHEKTHA
jgi:regulator of cell morphogenesis and NO signaling